MDPLQETSFQQNHARPAIHLAVLKIQLKKLVQKQAQQQQQQQEVIFTKDLIPLINQFEQEKHVNLLTDNQKEAILPFTKLNPDLEMTPDDIIHLLKLICPPSSSSSLERPPMPMPSLSEPTVSNYSKKSFLNEQSKPTTATMNSQFTFKSKSTHIKTARASWKRRPSTATSMSEHDRQQLTHYFNINGPVSKKQSIRKNNPALIMEEEEEDDAVEVDSDMVGTTSSTSLEEEEANNEGIFHQQQHEIAKYYRRSVQLTEQLKSSERSLLASIAQDNEDRIIHLQSKVDDMSAEVAKQKKEIQEFKGKEKNSLEQISALESHIMSIQRSETDQRQVYLSIKALFDEKCEETQKLQGLLKMKEVELQRTEDLLDQFQQEVVALSDERNRLRDFQNSLAQELETSAQAHQQLAEQKSENEKLKEIIDSLKMDLDEVLQHQQRGDGHEDVHGSSSRLVLQKKASTLSLKDEFDRVLRVDDLLTEEEDNICSLSIQDEKDYYKNEADEAKQDLERVKEELDTLRKALQSQNQLLVSELAGLKQSTATSRTRAQSDYNDTLAVVTSHIIPPLSPSSSTKTTAVAPLVQGLILPSSSTAAALDVLDEHLNTNNNTRRDSPIATMTEQVPADTPGVHQLREEFGDATSASYSTARIQYEHNNLNFRGQYHKRRRTVLDLHKAIDTEGSIKRMDETAIVFSPTDSTLPISLPGAINQSLAHHSRYNSNGVTGRTMTRQENRVVTQTVTFALYTVLVYFFGIITSTFLLDGSTPQQQQILEQAIAAASGSSSGGGQPGLIKSKVLEIILYWLEKLLIEPEGLPVS